MTKAKQQVLCATRREPVDSAAPAPIAVRAFAMGRPKTKQWRSPVAIRGKLFPSVKHLTLLNRYLNDIALRVGGSGPSSGECQSRRRGDPSIAPRDVSVIHDLYSERSSNERGQMGSH
jgi:hypothetical protein